MTRESARVYREAIETVIKNASLEGLVLESSRATYGDDGEYTVKLTFKEVGADGEADHSKEEAELHAIFRWCPIDRPIPRTLYGARAKALGKEFRIIGARPRAKASVIVEDNQGKKYAFYPEALEFVYD